MSNHHDTFFKQVFSNKANTIDFSKHALQETLATHLDYESFRMENVSYVDEHLAEYFSDVVYTCNYGKSKIRISLLFEHKSYPDKNLPRQLLKYILGIWDYNEKQKKQLTPVIPIVLYHGERSWYPNGMAGLFPDLPKELSPFIPVFDFIFVDLDAYSGLEIKNRIFNRVSMKISILVMKYVFYPEKLEQQLQSLFNLGKKLYRKESGLKFLETVVTYLLQATEIEATIIINAIEPISREGGRVAMNTAEKLRKEGRKEGRKEAGYGSYFNIIQTMKKNNLSDAEISRLTNLDIETVQKIANKEKVDIPLHLLEPNG